MAPAPRELLFFDTFSHEMVELNLDLVQFPSPVYVEEVRVIPLGARVEANFPGGVRLGATNPTQFTLECFVNDLSSPGTATFETVGTFQFHHDQQIHLQMDKVIPTDGLVLRGMYNAITLAVYGTLSNSTAEQIALEAAASTAAAHAGAQSRPAEACDGGEARTTGTPAGGNHVGASQTLNGGELPSTARSKSPGSDQSAPPLKTHDSPASKYSTPPPGSENRPSPTGGGQGVDKGAKDELLDNVSDISDGDIPDLNDDEAMPEAEVEEEEVSGGKENQPEEDRLSVPAPDEFMEAISDDEAEWSDEDMNELDFGDWEDPVKIHDSLSLELIDLTLPLITLAEVSDLNFDELGKKVTDLNAMVVDQKWIDQLDLVHAQLDAIQVRAALPESLAGPLRDICAECLNLEKAQRHALPAATIRHLKSGLKLVRKIAEISPNFLGNLVAGGMQDQLCTIIASENVSTSLKYWALELLDLSFDFQRDGGNRTSFYEFVLNSCATASLRLKSSFMRILNRFHLKEALQSLRSITLGPRSGTRCPIEPLLVTAWNLFQQLYEDDHDQKLAYSRSKDFIAAVLMDRLQAVFGSGLFLQCLLVHLSSPQSSKVSRDHCLKFLDKFSRSVLGLYYLSTDKLTTSRIIKYLLQGQSRVSPSNAPDEERAPDESHLSPIGLRIAYGTFALQQSLQLVVSKKPAETLEFLQNMYALCYSSPGQLALAHVLGSCPRVPTRLAHLAKLRESEEEVENGAIKGYATDLILLLLTHTDNLDLVKGVLLVLDEQSLIDDDRVSDENYVLDLRTDLIQWLKATRTATLGDFQALSQIIEKNVENTNPCASDLIQAIRALAIHVRGKRLSSESQRVQDDENLLQMFTNGVCDHFSHILDRINNNDHLQPHMHTATFVGQDGFLLVNAIGNMVSILKEILQLRIAAHGPGFKDMSLIQSLLTTYSLLFVVPESAMCHEMAQTASEAIIETLGLFTTTSFADSEAPSSVGSSVWTALLKETFAFTAQAPNCYLPGLDLIAQLLPLPAPILVHSEPTAIQLEEMFNCKKVWSVHLLLGETEFVQWAKHFMMAYQMVGQAFVRVLDQFCGLSPAICLVLAKAFVELCLELVEEQEWHVFAIVLSLGSNLTARPSFKLAVIKMLSEERGKSLMEKMKELTIAKIVDSVVLEHYVTIIGHLCDDSIFFTPYSASSSTVEEYLTKALPPQSLLMEFILYLWHLIEEENWTSLHRRTLDVLRVIGRHDLGFGLVQHCLTKILASPGLNLIKNVCEQPDPVIVTSKLNALLGFVDLVTHAPKSSDLSLPYHRSKTFKETHLKKFFGVAFQEFNDSVEKIKHKLSATVDAELIQAVDGLTQRAEKWAEVSDLNGEVDVLLVNTDLIQPSLADLFASASAFAVVEVDPDDQTREDDAPNPATDSMAATIDLVVTAEMALAKEFSFADELKKVCYEKSLATIPDPKVMSKKSELDRKALHNKSLISNYKLGGSMSIRGRVFTRLGSRSDGFRSRPANTSRPPSLHVDDFLVLQQRGQQPTGPTGYNKQSLLAAKELFAEREAQQHGKVAAPGFREATKEPVYDSANRSGGRRGGGGNRSNGGAVGSRGPRASRGWSPGEGGGDRRRGSRGGGAWSGDRRGPPGSKERRKLSGGGRDERSKPPPRSMNR